VHTSKGRDGNLPADPGGYRTVWGAGGTANGKKGASSRTPCIGEYNEREETDGVRKPGLERRHQYQETYRAGQETRGADANQTCRSAPQGRIT